MKLLILISSLLVFGNSLADRNYVTNNYTTEVITIINNDGNIARAIATSISNNHQFDFATYDYQGSVVGGWYDGEDAVSFGLAKRFGFMEALWHGSYTSNGSHAAISVGATFRF